jgi:hypothetical protein
MQVIIYGNKTFIIENPAAADIVRQAADLKQAGLDAEAAKRLDVAVQLEAGQLDLGQATTTIAALDPLQEAA